MSGLSGAAYAQAVPAGCTPGVAIAGGTVTCVVPPSPINGITTTVDDLTINIGAAGTPTAVVNAAGDGVNQSGAGPQSLSIKGAGSSVTGSADGVDISVTGGAGDLSLSSQGAISGGNNGVAANNNGTGGVTIDVTSVTGDTDGDGNGRGIDLNNNGASTGDASITATGTVSGGFDGIEADNTGTGNLTINAASVIGDSEGNGSGIGIDTFGGGNSGDISITATGAVRGGLQGIRAIQFGNGGVTVNAASVTGDADGNGIGEGIDVDINNAATIGDISITATGAVRAGNNGLNVNNNGTGGVTINVTSVTGDTDGNGNGRGIDLNNNGASTGDASITATGTVSGGFDGIEADNTGTGNLTINAASVIGDSEGNGSGIGIDTFGGGNSGDISITATGAVRGGLQGIRAIQFGNGGVTVNAASVTGDADGNGIGEGIDVDNDGMSATSITAVGAVSGATGILIRDRGNMIATTITTYGGVTGSSGTAINFQGDGNDVLNLGGGAFITGTVDMGNGNDNMGGTNPNDIDTLNALPGFNGVVTFADSSGGDSNIQSAPEKVSSNILLINGGTTAVAVDPTGFATSGLFLGALTNSIFNMIDNNSSAPHYSASSPSGTSSYQYSSGSPRLASNFGGLQEAKARSNISAFDQSSGEVVFGAEWWASSFGGLQEVAASANIAEIDHSFGGVMFGAENDIGYGRLGFFGGFGVSDLDLQFGAGGTDIETFFGGTYWKWDHGSHRIHMALAGGFVNHDSTRIIAGAPTPIANGDYNGWFFSPSITFATPLPMFPIPAITSIRASYAGMWLESYTETGAVANSLTVSDRNVHLFNARAQLALPNTVINDNGSHTQMELRIGVDGQWDAGSDAVNVVTGGTAIIFDANLDDDISGFIGASLTHTNPDKSFAVTLSGEVQPNFDGGFGAIGELKATIKF